ncbi:hypothetical protein 3 [Hubei toti-like virus 16]|uniref:hypothetical protein 3 n=1 Tax=Hubei toti-like virus 16 TaxID=1923304 RepID=UPI00090C04DB|nr:hypothetical protein 3 [Hubei toti-like virus 16]APG76033.1 hypothetical protein 3 [Hubei toti-like virus 16]
MDFRVDPADLPILTSSTTRDQASAILRANSEIFQSLVPDAAPILDIVRESGRRLAGSQRRQHSDPRWGDQQHDKLFKLSGVKRLTKLAGQPFVFACCFSLLVQVSNVSVRRILLAFVRCLSELNVDLHHVNVDDFRAIMKDQTVVVKHLNSRLGLGSDWVWFAEWDQFCGFNASGKQSRDSILAKINDWCTGPIARMAPGLDAEARRMVEDYYVVYRIEARRLLSFLTRSEGVCPPYEEWCLATDQWVTSGSSRGVRIPISDVVTENVVKSKNSKAVFANSLSSKNIGAMMRGELKPEGYSVAEKVEPGQKGRLIISAGLQQQLRMCYIDSVIGKNFKKLNNKTTLFMNADSIKDFYDKMIGLCIDPTNIHLPLDVSGFDTSVARLEVEIIFEEMYRALEHSPLVNKQLVLDMLRLSMVGWFGENVLLDGDVVATWERGIPSGVKWTAKIGTLIGVLRFQVCKVQLARDRRFGPPVVVSECFQGDDISIVLKRLVDVVRIIQWYNNVNVDVSATKNFISNDYDEFLRKVFFKGGMTGYPARRMVKLIFRDPLKTGPANILDSIRSNVTSIWSLIWRGADKEKIIELIKYGVKKQLSKAKWIGEPMSANDIDRWLTTATCLGGLGLDCANGVNRIRPCVIEIVYDDISPGDRYRVGLAGINKDRVAKVAAVTNFGGEFTSEIKSVSMGLAPEPPRVIYHLKKVFPVLNLVRVNLKTVSIFNRSRRIWKEWLPREDLLHLPYLDVVNVACSDGDIDRLRSLSHDSVLSLFDTILARCHVSVLYHWIKNDLPSVSLSSSSCNDLVCSVFCDRVKSQLLSSLLSSRKNITYTHIINGLVLSSELVYSGIMSAKRAKILYFYGS